MIVHNNSSKGSGANHLLRTFLGSALTYTLRDLLVLMCLALSEPQELRTLPLFFGILKMPWKDFTRVAKSVSV